MSNDQTHLTTNLYHLNSRGLETNVISMRKAMSNDETNLTSSIYFPKLRIIGPKTILKEKITLNDRTNLTSNLYHLITITLIFSLSLVSHSHSQNLNSYLTEASTNNPLLKSKYLEFEAALTRVTQVNSLPDPTLSFGVFISPIETRVGAQRAKISLSQVFPWFGTLKAKEDAATLMADVKYQELISAKNQLYYQVKQAYYPIYEINQQIQIQSENLDILVTYLKLAEVRFANGKGSMADKIRVEIMIEDIKTDIILLKDQVRPYQVKFNKLLNRPDSSSVLISDTLTIPDLINDYRKDSLLINPQLEKIILEINAYEAYERVAKKQGLPKLGLGLDYVIVGQRSDLVGMAMSDNGKDAMMPTVSMSLPIFRSKYKAASDEAELMQQSMKYQYDNTLNDLESSYEMAWYELQKSKEQLKLYDTQIDKSNKVIDLLYTTYSNSGNDFEEVLKLQMQLLKYQKARISAIKNYHLALAKLDYITFKNNQ